MKDLLFTPSTNNGVVCKGLFFRGFKSRFLQNGRFEEKQGIRLLKRTSCPGCDKCYRTIDDMIERTDAIIMPEIENGALYTVRVTNQSTDWETGYVDDWDIEIVKLG